jgi:hypothetical protein
MSTVTTISVLSLSDLRQGVADAVKRAYGAERDYAQKLCEVLPVEWYLVEHNDKGEEAKIVHTEKKALFAELKKAEHSNPSTIWARVRKYAQEYVHGSAEGGEGEGAEGGEGEGAEGVGARHARSADLRLIEELSALWKFLGRQESLTDKQTQCKEHICFALLVMGVDPATVG